MVGWSLVASLAAVLSAAVGITSPSSRLRAQQPPESPELTPARRRKVRVAVLTGLGVVLVLSGPIGLWSLPTGTVAGLTANWFADRLVSGAAAARAAEQVAGLPQLCDLMAVCLEAGLPLRRCVEVLAEALPPALAEPLHEVAAKTRVGADEAAAWSELAAAESELARLGEEIARNANSGVAMAAGIRSLGVEARSAAANAAEIRARRVGVRSVLPLMVCFLPAFMLLGVVPIIGGVAAQLLG